MAVRWLFELTYTVDGVVAGWRWTKCQLREARLQQLHILILIVSAASSQDNFLVVSSAHQRRRGIGPRREIFTYANVHQTMKLQNLLRKDGLI